MCRTHSSLRRWIQAAFVLVLAACAPPPKRPNVVVIVLDTVRPDYLSAYDFAQPTSPYLERFAKQGTRFDRAWSTSSWTLPAHASLFSGTLPAFHRATQSTEHVAADVPLLAERLRNAGYQTLALTNNTWVSKATGLDRGFDLLRDQWNIRERRRSMGAQHPTVQALKQWFQRARDPNRPFFAFINLTPAHMPYLPHWEEAEPFFPDRQAWERAINELFPDAGTGLLIRQFGTGKVLDERELGELRALYAGALRRVDAITEALMAVFDEHSDPKETFVFVLSDHGENLGEHGHVSHVFNLYDTCLRIALLARGPGFDPGAEDEHEVQITDVYPTVLKAAGLEPEEGCVGLDLLGDLPERRMLASSLERPVITFDLFPEAVQRSGALARFDHPLAAAIGPEYKQILTGDGVSELYDLRHDPGETNPLPALPPESAQHLAQVLAQQRELGVRRKLAELKGNARQDPQSRKGLQDLGYTGEDK